MSNNNLVKASKVRIYLTGQWGKFEVVHAASGEGENFRISIHKAEIGHTIVKALRERYVTKGMAERDRNLIKKGATA